MSDIPAEYELRTLVSQYEKQYSAIFDAIEELSTCSGDGVYDRPERPEIIDIANNIEDQLERLDEIIHRICQEEGYNEATASS